MVTMVTIRRCVVLPVVEEKEVDLSWLLVAVLVSRLAS